MNLLTGIVLVIMAIYILRGYRRGFIKSLASMASLIISIILVNFATPYVTEFLKSQTPVYDYVLEKCEDTFVVSQTDIKSNQKKPTEEEDKSTDAGQMNSADDKVIDQLPLPEALKDVLKENNTPEYYAALAAKSISDFVPKYMANLILNIISFIVTFILIMSFIWLAVTTLNIIAALPVLNGINRILGLALGFVQGLIIVWIAFLIITIFSNTDIGRQLMTMIAESPVLSVLYDSNLLLDFLQNMIKNIF